MEKREINSMYEEAFRKLNPGDLLEGKIISENESNFIVDVGYKYEGLVPKSEFGSEVPDIGSRVAVIVRKVNDDEGRIVLTHSGAVRRIALERIKEAYETRSPVKGEVRSRVKGGYLVDVGVSAFLPFSLSGISKHENPDELVGKEIEAYVESFDYQRKKIVLDRKTLIEEIREREIESFIKNLKRGDILTGKVTAITSFGVFVNVGPMEGLVRTSDISWGKVGNISEVVKPGETYRVAVLSVDAENKKLQLGIKQAQKSIWHERVKSVRVGEVIKGRIKKVTKKGIYIWLRLGLDGFLPLKELRKYTRKVGILREGDSITVKVKSIDTIDREIILGHPTL